MKIKKICIVGGGTAGWMTAAGLARKFKNSGLHITLVESEQIGTVGVGEATLPHIRFYNNSLGIDEAEFMQATKATFKMGIEFCDWGKIGDRYIHPFGDYGEKIDNIEFYHYWNKLRILGEATRLDDYSFAVISSELGRFRFPDIDNTKIESSFGYAYQFDSSLYAKFLRKHAETNGVQRIEGTVVDVHTNSESGFITKLQLSSGSMIEAELFIDCTGFRGVLIEQTLKSGFEDWTKWLPCNRAIAIPSANTGKLMPFTRATARKAGWQWNIPLQHRTGNGHVYWSEHISDDEAHKTLLDNLEGEALADANLLYFKTGKRKKIWKKNVIAIGLSAGFLEPLESTSIYLIQEGITALLELFPDNTVPQSDIEEYNSRMDLYYERVRDFLLLHYVATKRKDSEMWKYFTNMPLPESLQDKINAWRHRGHIIKYEIGAFLPPSWVAVMIGQNILPKHYDRRIDKMPLENLHIISKSIRKNVLSTAQNTMEHQAFLNKFIKTSHNNMTH